MSKQFELIALMAQSGHGFGSRDAVTLVNGCINRMSDIKLKGPIGDALLAAGEAVSPGLLVKWLNGRAAKHVNPKVTSECINWTVTALDEFGMQVGTSAAGLMLFRMPCSKGRAALSTSSNNIWVPSGRIVES